MSVPEYSFLRVESRGRIAEVTLDRPPVNAINGAMYAELADLLPRIGEAVPDARVVILRGAGKHFCAGTDVAELETLDPANAPGRLAAYREGFFGVYRCPLPLIGAVHGAVLGTGLAIAASCDFVVAAEGASFGLPEVGVGIVGGSKHLSRLVPLPIARWMLLSADPVPVEELARYGAVLEVVPPERLLDAARARAERVARHSPVALRLAKHALNAGETLSLVEGFELEHAVSVDLMAHPDAGEARRSFFERREPRYLDDVTG